MAAKRHKSHKSRVLVSCALCASLRPSPANGLGAASPRYASLRPKMFSENPRGGEEFCTIPKESYSYRANARMIQTAPVSSDAVTSAAQKLDAQVREIIQWHFSPDTGT